MAYVLLDGTVLTSAGTGIPRVAHRVIRAAADQVGTGRPVDRLAVVTLRGRVHESYDLGGVPTEDLDVGPRRWLYEPAILRRPDVLSAMDPFFRGPVGGHMMCMPAFSRMVAPVIAADRSEAG